MSERKKREAWTKEQLAVLFTLANSVNGSAGTLAEVVAGLAEKDIVRDEAGVSVKLSNLRQAGLPIKTFPRGASGPRIDLADMLDMLANVAGINEEEVKEASAAQVAENAKKAAERAARKAEKASN